MEKLNLKIISDNIAWDGSYFNCRRCGKSGYNTMQAVKGHLSMCPGKAIQKGATQLASQPATASHSPVGTASIGNIESYPASQPPPTAGPDNSQLDKRIATLENEYNHLLAENNNPNSSSDWVSRNKDILIILGILVALYLILQESKCKCANEGSGRSRANGLGSTLANRAAGKAIDYGLSKILK